MAWREPRKHKNYTGFSLSATFSLLPAAKLGKSEDSKASPARGKTRNYGKKANLLLEAPSTAGELLTSVKSVLPFSSPEPARECSVFFPQVKRVNHHGAARVKLWDPLPKELGSTDNARWKECLELSLEACWVVLW